MVVFICVLCVLLLKAHAVSDVYYSIYITEKMYVCVCVCVCVCVRVCLPLLFI